MQLTFWLWTQFIKDSLAPKLLEPHWILWLVCQLANFLQYCLQKNSYIEISDYWYRTQYRFKILILALNSCHFSLFYCNFLQNFWKFHSPHQIDKNVAKRYTKSVLNSKYIGFSKPISPSTSELTISASMGTHDPGIFLACVAYEKSTKT